MKLAFVIPWYGPVALGGAEAECQRTVENLQCRGCEVEVLTTCVRDFRSDWNVNHFRPGVERVNDVAVRRFLANPRNSTRFDYVNIKLMHGRPVLPEEERWFIEDSIRSDALDDFVRHHRRDYRFVFIPYMFGTTYWGSMACPGEAFLIPCLHDEVYAHLSIYGPMFHRMRGVLFHSDVERELAQGLYGLGKERAHVVGGGIDTAVGGDGEAFRKRRGLSGPFVLYVGRKDAGKNVGELVAHFRRYRERRGGELKLVLMGAGELSLGPSRGRAGPEIVDLGFVERQEMLDGLAAASVLCQPSLNESFSRVLMDAWLCGTPALVHGRCAATREHCLASSGGLFYESYAEFEGCLDWFLGHPEAARAMAAQGREYVLANFGWERVLGRLERVLLR